MKRIALGTVMAVVIGVASPAWSPAAAQIQVCTQYSPGGFCLEWGMSGGGGTPTGGSGPSAAPTCYWATLPGPPDIAFPDPPPDVPVVWQSWACPGESVAGVPVVRIRWVVAEEVSPEDLAMAANARLAGRLPSPEVVSSPPEGTAAILGVPTFVAVANWTGEVRETECAAGLCVTVVAAPALSFSPGEPGAGTIDCAGSGTRHQPGGDPLAEARRPGACAYAYRLRTGAAGRPGAWDGEVTVAWTIGWSASNGASGSLPTVSLTSFLPRAVEEVQGIVVEGQVP